MTSPALHRSDRIVDYDVVVIGAGAAGIAACRALVEAGARVSVLEARSRPGGRAFTDSCVGLPFDAGAAYVHYAETNPWVQLAADLGVALQPHRGWGNGVAMRGHLRDDGAARDRRIGAARFWELLSDVDMAGPDRSVLDLVQAEDARVRAAATRYSRHAIGEEPELIGVADLVTQWSGPDLTVPGGYGTLVGQAAAGLPVTFDCAVSAIRWNSTGVRIASERGDLSARAVIVTVPLGVLAAERIRFEPMLPPATRDAIGRLRMGALTKVVLAFDGERFGWPSPSDIYPVGSEFHIELWPFDRNLVIATIGGQPARDLVRQGERSAVAQLLEVFSGIVGAKARRHVTGGRLADWVSDPFSLGAYSVAGPGDASARLALAEPVGGRVFFAGEATSGGAADIGGAMTVGGATIAGLTAAREALALSRP